VILQAGTVILPDRILRPGHLIVDGERVVETRAGHHPRPDREFASGTLVPGFIDLQINGAAGCDFLSPTDEGLAAADRHMLATGTVAYLPTLITSPEDGLRAALAFFTARMHRAGAPRILGVHLEGPFLSSARVGAHRPAYLRAPSVQWIDRLLGDFQGVVRIVTLAPELDGAPAVIAHLRGKGVTVAAGHTDATFEQAMAAFGAGVRLATHLFNAMRPMHQREPGIVGAALAHPEVSCSLIADLVSVHPAVLKLVASLKGPERTVLVTDAISAAGGPPGRVTLGDQVVRVEEGAPRLPDGTLAGSVLTMDQAVRTMSAMTDLPAAVKMAAETPARLVAHDGGAIAPGRRADFAVLDERHHPIATIVGGRVAYQRAT
jgi:N-acetylglucosamine-6-phosphate deacetylase